MKMAQDQTHTDEIRVDDREIAKLNALHAHKATEKRMDMGLIGRLFGSSVQIPGNVAGLVVTASFILFGFVLFWLPDTPSLSKKDALTIVGGFITLGLGFLFGRTTS
jgi:hypothetical protein